MRSRIARVTVVAVLAGLLGFSVERPAPARASGSRAAFTVSPTMTMNDPTHRRGNIARQLRSYIRHTPSGATISIMSFYIQSSITWPALRAAYLRGVNVQAVLYGGRSGKPIDGLSWEGVRLAELIAQGRRNGRKGSWVVWTKGTARGKDGNGGVMHAKVWQFSRVGATKHVTMIGSYNNGDKPDGRAFHAMVTLPGRKLYRATQDIILASAKDRYVGRNPQQRVAGVGWDAYFFPSTPITRGNDPALQRLQSIPANDQTRMTIAMYAMTGYRGTWLARRLASMVERGAHLTFVVGPDIAPSVVRTLRNAGADLQDGCWKTGRKEFPYAYTHDKEMTATWVEDGERQYAAWLGSDDWGSGSGGSDSDQAVVGLYSKWAFQRLNKLLAPLIAHRPDRLTRCDPLP